MGGGPEKASYSERMALPWTRLKILRNSRGRPFRTRLSNRLAMAASPLRALNSFKMNWKQNCLVTKQFVLYTILRLDASVSTGVLRRKNVMPAAYASANVRARIHQGGQIWQDTAPSIGTSS